MKDFSFETQGTNTYLVYEITVEDAIDSMSLGMLANNKIPGLAPVIFTQMNTQKFIKYNVSAKISVKQFFAGPVNKKRLIGVFSGIADAMLSAEDYMIDTNSIIMDLDYIFADVSTCETILICLPIIVDEKIHKVDLAAFFKNIMFSTQFDQTENCDYVAKIMNYLNSTPVFSLADFKELLNSIDINQAIQSNANQDKFVASHQTKIAQAPVQQHSVVEKQVPKVEQSMPIQPAVTKPAQIGTQTSEPAIPIQVPQEKNNEQKISEEKKISMFGLLMHYNKENAAAYKAQKEAKKRAATANKGVAPVQQVPVKKPEPVAQPANNFGFAVPGQPTPAAQPVTSPAAKPAVQPEVQPTIQSNIQKQPEAPIQQPAYVPREITQGQMANFGETTVLSGGAIGETTVLSVSNNPVQMIAPHLIRKKNNEKISLNKPVFRVGKERSYVDYFIGDNTAVSRSHANFIIREESYFVVDTNSTNHTFVNGTMINSNEEVQINHGDTVKLANEEFEFKIY